MKKFFYDLFGEASSLSMVRVESLIVVTTACYLALSKGPESLGVISILLTTGFGAKVIQKSIELSGRKEDKD
jgi:multisubunit Na+/H+ antiporter MnhG subunit